MIVYHASKKGFIKDVFNGTIADDIDHAFCCISEDILLPMRNCHGKIP